MTQSEFKNIDFIVKIIVIAIVCSLLFLVCGCESEDKKEDVSEAMNYEEMVEYYAGDFDISIDDAKGKLKKIGIEDEEKTSYRVMTKTLTAGEKYTPKATFYLETSEDKDGWKAREVKGVDLVFDGEKGEGVFGGSLTIWVRKNNQFEYIMDIDVYEEPKEGASVECRKNVVKQKGEGMDIGYVNFGFSLTSKGPGLDESTHEYIHRHEFFTVKE